MPRWRVIRTFAASQPVWNVVEQRVDLVPDGGKRDYRANTFHSTREEAEETMLSDLFEGRRGLLKSAEVRQVGDWVPRLRSSRRPILDTDRDPFVD